MVLRTLVSGSAVRASLLLLAVLLAAALAAGCIKRPEPARATSPTPVAAVFLLDQESETDVLEAPESLTSAARAMLESRNLPTRILPAADWSEAFARRRSTRQRMQYLLENTDEDVVLLVETRARLASLMEGRYSWTVPVQITLARRGQTDFPVQAMVEAPVFLRFAHQQAPEAVEAAEPVVVRRLGKMVDELLAGELASLGSSQPGIRGKERSEERDAIYFVMVDRYRNGDRANDAGADPTDPQAFHGGDLRGVIDDLDRIRGMGFSTVWLSPVWDTRDERIGEWGAFHGYWVEDPGAVEPRFGTQAELVELREALTTRGMGLVLDFVANHVAPGSPILTEHQDWFHARGDIEDWGDAEQAITHDVHGLPDFAQERPEVARWIIDHARRWQEVLRPEGFRLDAVRHVAPAFWSELNAALREQDPDVALIGELFDGSPDAVAASWRDGAFSGMFDFPLHYALTDVFCDDAPVGRLAAALARDRAYSDPSALVTFLDNHDLPRLASRCDRDAMAGALSTLFALRGRPSVTWGTELPLSGAEEPANRADFDWDAERVFEKQIALGLRIRSRWGALRAPSRQVWVLDDGLFAWVQGDAQTAAFIAVNRGDTERSVTLPDFGQWLDPALGRPAGSSLRIAPGAVAIVTADAGPERMAPWLESVARPARVDVTVRVTAPSLADGEQLLLVGASDELGGWDPARAVAAQSVGGDLVATVSVPQGDVLEFKFVRRDEAGGLVWEQRANRYHLVVGRGEIRAGWEA